MAVGDCRLVCVDYVYVQVLMQEILCNIHTHICCHQAIVVPLYWALHLIRVRAMAVYDFIWVRSREFFTKYGLQSVVTIKYFECLNSILKSPTTNSSLYILCQLQKHRIFI